MQAAISLGERKARSYAEDIHWLRVNMLRRLIGATLVVASVWWVILTAFLEVFELRLWPGPLALLFGILLARAILDRSGFAPALVAYGSCLGLSILFLAWGYSDPSFLVLLALPVGAVSLLVGPRAGLVAAAMVSAALAGVALGPASFPIPQATLRLGAILAFATALLLWVAMYPLRTTVDWAWKGYERAREQTERMREQRGKLNQTVKDLQAAYERLESMTVELERARKAADEGRRLKAEFAANISHELRTPLNLIIGFSEMLARAPHIYDSDQAMAPAFRGDVQAIYRNAQHLSHLINDVLDLSQIEAGRMGLNREPLSIREVVAEALSAVSQLFTAKGLTVNVDLPEIVPIIQADRTRLRQVLINLLNNASRFTDQGGVSISATSDERDVMLAVADTGVGIAEEDIPKVFEQFRQIDGSTRRHVEGSGLGLAISKRFVELHGGRMWVTSRLGEGTTFFFTLPRREELGIAQPPPEWDTWARLRSTRSDQKAVIVLDKDPANVALFQRYLDAYRVLGAATPGQARGLAAQEPIHALVLPATADEEGWRDLQQGREALPNLPLAVCTLSTGTQTPLPLNVRAYLVKPISQDRFLAALAGLGGRVRNLLVVDDDPEVVDLLSRMVSLAPRPYRVTQAYDGAQALQIMHRRRPGAVVLDLIMPEIDGLTVLERMQADPQLCKIPVILATATGRQEGAITAGMVGFTQRDGFSVGELMRCLRAGLDALHPPALTYTGPEPGAASPE